MNDMQTARSFPFLNGDVVTARHYTFCVENGHAKHTADGVVQERCPRCGEIRVEAAATFAVWGQNTRTLTPAFEVETFPTREEADDYARGLKRLDDAKFDYWVQ